MTQVAATHFTINFDAVHAKGIVVPVTDVHLLGRPREARPTSAGVEFVI
jgi:hypothetical protein